MHDGKTRIATVQVQRYGEDGISIAQMRGPCNAILPKPLQAQIVRWARQKDKWTLPGREPRGRTRNPWRDLNEIPF